MKRTMLMTLTGAILTFCTGLWAQDGNTNDTPYTGFGDYQLHITRVIAVDEVQTKEGVMKSENRQSHLLEVQLTGTVPAPGISILNRAGFSAVFLYRGQYRVVPSRAVGVKPEVAPGVTKEIIISSPEANMNCKNSKGGGTEVIYLYFDIPQEVKTFQVQVPHLLPAAATGS